jgi:hypothetical protein
MPFETFVESRDRTETTHAICPDCQATMSEFASEPKS